MGVARGVRELPDDFYGSLARDYQQKRDTFCGALAKAGLAPSIPDGAYYVLADVSRIPGDTGKARAMYLLEKTGVAGVPGEAFFRDAAAGARFIRFSYAKTDPDLADACWRLTHSSF
jgi:aminotransferase